MKRELGRLGVPFQRIVAIAAGDVANHEDHYRIPPQEQRAWTKGELACLLTHREAWKHIAAGPFPFGAVLEDDLHLHPSFRGSLFVSGIPSDADIVKLETTNEVVRISRCARGVPGQRFHFRRMNGVNHGSGAYVISRSCAARAVNAIEKFSLSVDDSLFGSGATFGATLTKYQQVPASVVQDCILPGPQRSPELSSMLEVERQVAIGRRPLSRRAGALSSAIDAVRRLPSAVLRRIAWRYSRVPFAGGSLDD